MTPLEEFRLWWRQGPPFERVSASVAAVLFVALIGWVLIPSGSSAGSSVAVGAAGGASVGSGATGEAAGAGPSGQAAGSGASQAAGGAASGGSGGSAAAAVGSSGSSGAGSGSPAAGTSAGSASPSGSAGEASPSARTAASPGLSSSSASCPSGATDQGVTATTINLAVTLIDVSGANSILGVPSPSTQQSEDAAEVKAINSSGGVDCRKLAVKYYTDNPLDANAEHSLCLQIVSDKPFAIIGGLYTPQNLTCLPQNHIPSFTQTPLSTALQRQFYPYLFSPGSSAEVFDNYVLGAKQVGYFNGLGKLGVLTETCYPDFNPEMMSALSRAGIPSSKIETFSYGCPAGSIPDPASVQSAVLQFQRDGVTHVMSAGAAVAGFTKQAQVQGYHPRYATSDLDSTLQLAGSTNAGDPNNLNGAYAITGQQYGALNSGTPLSPATAQCDAIMRDGGAPTAEAGDAYAGGVCVQFTYFLNAVEHAPALTRTALAVGLDRSGHVDMSYPDGPALWNQSGVTWGGQYWRYDRFYTSCSCWKVADATFHPSFG